MRMRFRHNLKWIIAAALLAYAASPAGAQQGPAGAGGAAAPGAADAQVGFQRKAQLSPQEQVLEGDRSIPLDPAIVRALERGDGGEAVRLTCRRLVGSGIVPSFRAGALPPERARLIAASLAFPVTQKDARRWAGRLSPLQDRA